MAAAPQGPVSIRLETGDLFNPGLNHYETRRWEYVRLEGGEDRLVGPSNLTPTEVVVARMAAGDIDTLTQGNLPG